MVQKNKIKGTGKGIFLSLFLAAAFAGAASGDVLAGELSAVAASKPDMKKAGSVPTNENRVTYGQPFASGTAGSVHFRIPALITLQDGTLLATADARWETASDGGGLDTIASISKDGGKTWHYSFPFYFPDSNGYYGTSATTIIDPGVVEGPDGTIYVIADVNPTGSTTLYKTIPTGTGYMDIENSVDQGRFLALTEVYDDCLKYEPDANPRLWPYYVSRFDENGYAKIRRADTGAETGYGVDEWYNLYTVAAGTNFYVNNLEQPQVNQTSVNIQQNVFYKDSKYHVYSIGYLWVVTSKDGGNTWEHPRDLTDQIKRPTGENALLVSPGQGITTKCGDIAIGFYDHGSAGNNREDASIVYSTDQGKSWKRTEDLPDFWSSENEIIELSDGTLRMFVRSGQGQIAYIDAKKDENGEYRMGSGAVKTGVGSTSTCNVTAISYSKKINGKQAILVGCPTGGSRKAGKIFVFLVNEDETHTMELFETFSVPGSDNGYVYSCLTEMKDGSIALLWEPNDWDNHRSILFDKFNILDIVPNADLSTETVNVSVEEGEVYERTYHYAGQGALSNDGRADAALVNIAAEVSGTDATIRITGKKSGYTETVIDRICYKITVTDHSVWLNRGESYEPFHVLSVPEYVGGEAIELTSAADGVKMFDHIANKANSMESFASSPNTQIALSDMEFTFTRNGDWWNIYNEKTNKYLVNDGGGSYFNAAAQDMAVVPIDGRFRISKSDNTRYVVFYYPNMDFNSHSGGYQTNYANGTQELWLLEKQASSSEGDLLPGYKEVTAVTEGRKYLICYKFEGRVILLYPANGTAKQTKAAKLEYQITVMGRNPGSGTVIADGKKYRFKVKVESCSHPETEIRGQMAESCLWDGYTGDTYCTNPVCGVLVSKGIVIPSRGGHLWDGGTEVKHPTETEDGAWLYICRYNPLHRKTERIYASAYALMKSGYDGTVHVLQEEYGLYTKRTVQEVQKVYEQEKQIEGYLTRGQMYRKALAFRTALDALEKKTAEELAEELSDVLTEAGNLKKKVEQAGTAGLPAGLKEALDTKYEQAAALQDKTDSDQIWVYLFELRSADQQLTQAFDRLKGARDSLAGLLASANAFYKDGQGASAYTPQTWQPFAAAYQAAAAQMPSASADTLGELEKNLREAQAKLAAAAVVPGAGTPSQEASIAAGRQVTIDQTVYAVTDAAARTVKVVSSAAAKPVIPAEIPIGGQMYAVTEIGEKAFEGAKNTLQSVVIGKNVTVIGDHAFAGCKKLKTAVIGAGVMSIGKNAFSGCKKLGKITIQGMAVKMIKSKAFAGTKKTVSVVLPKGMKASAKNSLKNKLKKQGKLSAGAKIK